MVSALFAWWLGQLADLLPRWVFRPASGNADALVIAPVGSLDDAVAVTATMRRSGNEIALGHFPFAGGEIKELPAPTGQPVALRLQAREVLAKTLVLPLAAQTDLEQALAFEMDRETPFEAEELYWNYQVTKVDRQRKQLHVSLSLLPKTRVDPLVAALSAIGLTPSWVELEGRQPDAVLQLDGLRQRDHASRFLVPAAVCCALLAAATMLTPFVKQAIALGALDHARQTVGRAADRAEALRREIDQLSRGAELIDEEVTKFGRPLEVLANLTRALPDDTYLTACVLRGRKLTLNGRSAGAARLIGALAGDGGFRNPSFAAPVTRLEGLDDEVFTIIAEVSPSP